MKKRIYLVQASAVYGESVKSVYLPYAIGCLAAYAFADERIKEEYTLGRFIFLREDIDAVVASLEEPYFVGFSTYIWNMEYNRIFAKKLKEKYPDVIIAFGGHNVKPDGSDLNDIPEADVIMHGEGEEVFKNLLLSLANGDSLRKVSGISYRAEGAIISTPAGEPADIASFPSPYTEGYFDDIIKDPEILPSIVWETNRGCPNRCAFCDWGSLKSKLRQFPMERIRAELDWMAENKIEYVYCADSNFGIYPRDTEIADMIIAYNEKYGYPKVFRTNYTKNKDDVVFEISSKLINRRIGKSPTLSFQSLSPDVLEKIGRNNMDLVNFKRLMARYSEAKVPVFSELILGLPGETYDSFTDGICDLIESNQHTALGIYPCELLPNSRMGSREYCEKYGIRTVRTEFAQYHTKPENDGIREISNIVIATSDMGPEDWKRSFIFSVCVQTFHNLALTRAVAIYLNKEKNVAYKRFYEALIEYIASAGENTVCGRVFRKIRALTDGVVDGKNSFSCLYGDEERLLWSFEEYMFLVLAKEADRFYDEIGGFVRSFGVEDDIFDALMTYQNAIIKKPGKPGMELTLDYDFYGYFCRIYQDGYKPLEKIKNTISVCDTPAASWDEYARLNVWYGRRDDAQLYTGKKNTVYQTFG